MLLVGVALRKEDENAGNHFKKEKKKICFGAFERVLFVSAESSLY